MDVTSLQSYNPFGQPLVKIMAGFEVGSASLLFKIFQFIKVNLFLFELLMLRREQRGRIDNPIRGVKSSLTFVFPEFKEEN